MSKPDSPNSDIASRRAVALRWDGAGAPTVKAKGRGIVAEEIVAIAREAGVPMHEDLALVTVLSGLELEEEIPPELYLAIAQILTFAYEVSGKTNPLLGAGINRDTDRNGTRAHREECRDETPPSDEA